MLYTVALLFSLAGFTNGNVANPSTQTPLGSNLPQLDSTKDIVVTLTADPTRWSVMGDIFQDNGGLISHSLPAPITVTGSVWSLTWEKNSTPTGVVTLRIELTDRINGTLEVTDFTPITINLVVAKRDRPSLWESESSEFLTIYSAMRCVPERRKLVRKSLNLNTPTVRASGTFPTNPTTPIAVENAADSNTVRHHSHKPVRVNQASLPNPPTIMWNRTKNLDLLLGNADKKERFLAHLIKSDDNGTVNPMDPLVLNKAKAVVAGSAIF